MNNYILISLSLLFGLNAYSQKVSVEQLMSKTDAALDRIETMVYKTNLSEKGFSEKDTIYQEAICSLFIEPRDKIGMFYITNIVWDNENIARQIYNGEKGSFVNVLKNKTLDNFKVFTETEIENIRGFGNISFLNSILFDKNQRFTNEEKSNFKKIELLESFLDKEPVYILTLYNNNRNKCDDCIQNVIREFYIRKTDFLPIARSFYGEFQGMYQYEFVTIDYLGINTLKKEDFIPYTKIDDVNIEAIYEQNKVMLAPDSFANKNNKPKIEFKQVSVEVDLSKNKFPFNDFTLSDGNKLKLSDLKGKVVLLDFWYRSCLPCIKAMPELAQLQKEFKKDLVVIGVNDRDEQAQVEDFLKYKKVNYPSTYKSELHISNSLKINSFPTAILIDKNGNIVLMESGFNKDKIKKTIKNLIKQ